MHSPLRRLVIRKLPLAEAGGLQSESGMFSEMPVSAVMQRNVFRSLIRLRAFQGVSLNRQRFFLHDGFEGLAGPISRSYRQFCDLPWLHGEAWRSCAPWAIVSAASPIGRWIIWSHECIPMKVK
jgi:hypothetical protein